MAKSKKKVFKPITIRGTGNKRKGSVQFYADKKGEFRWNLKSMNGRIVAESGEGYKTINGCLKGFKALTGICACVSEEGLVIIES